jgi:hypothetical protein
LVLRNLDDLEVSAEAVQLRDAKEDEEKKIAEAVVTISNFSSNSSKN